MRRRDLTPAEAGILRIIQEGYGLKNTADEVFFTEADEAVMFVKASDSSSRVMAKLSNLAGLRADGTIPSDEELRRDWLRL